jgi:hypothetical protein
MTFGKRKIKMASHVDGFIEDIFFGEISLETMNRRFAYLVISVVIEYVQSPGIFYSRYKVHLMTYISERSSDHKRGLLF